MAFDIQKQIKENAQDIQNYYKDLYDWEDEIQQKNQNPNTLKSSLKQNQDKEVKIRGNVNQSDNQQELHQQSQQESQQQQVLNEADSLYKRDKNTIQDYYKAWDKFDVEEEMLRVDVPNQKKAQQLSEQAAKQYENSQNKPKAAAKQKLIVKGGRKTGLAQINQIKDKANLNFRNSDFQQALDLFSEAIDKILEKKDNELNEEEKNLKAILYCNRSMTYLKLQEYANAEKDATICLEITPNNAKAYYRRGLAKKKMGQLENALEDFLKSANLDSTNLDIKNEINSVERTIQMQKEQAKQKMIIEERSQENESIKIVVQDHKDNKIIEEIEENKPIVQQQVKEEENVDDRSKNQQMQKDNNKNSDDSDEEMKQKEKQKQNLEENTNDPAVLIQEQLEGSLFLKLKNIEGKFKKHVQKPGLKRYKSLQTGIKQPKASIVAPTIDLGQIQQEPANIKKSKISQEELKISEVEDYDSDNYPEIDSKELFSSTKVKFGGVSEEAPKRLSQPKLNLKPIKSILKLLSEDKPEKPKFLEPLEIEKRRSLDMRIQEDMTTSCQKKQISKFGQQKQVISETKFTDIWNKNKHLDENRLEFLNSLMGQDLHEIFKEGIDFSLLFEIWKLFNDNYEKDKDLVQHYLQSLYKIKRFEINMKALIKSEKELIKNFLTKLSDANELSAELFTTYKQFL